MNNAICQSCGMPLKQDPKKGGTNADGSISDIYCSYCYEDGDFLCKAEDVYEFQSLCKEKMSAEGMNKIFIWFFSSKLFAGRLKKLSRWSKK
jgi:hypothetical protein